MRAERNSCFSSYVYAKECQFQQLLRELWNELEHIH